MILPPLGRIGRDPLTVSVMEDNSTAYLDWIRLGARSRILVHFDSHLDAEGIGPSRLSRILACKDLRALKRLERDPYDSRTVLKPLDLKNYVTAAAECGMIREMWWVVPEKSLIAHAAQYREGIADCVQGLKRAEAVTFRRKGPRLSMRLHGMALNLCVLKDLPSFTEKVLLDIDADWFDPPWEEDYFAPPFMEPVRLVKALARRGLAADWVGVCYSNRQGYLALWKRQAADELIEHLRNPAEPLSRRLLRLRAARRSLAARDFARGAAQIRSLPAQERSAHGNYLLSLCLSQLGRTRWARAAYRRACSENSLYSWAPLFQADWYFNKKLFARSLELYAHAARSPGPHLKTRQARTYLHHQLGWSALQLGELERAEYAFKTALRLFPGCVSAQLSLAQIAERRSDFPAALARYDRALRWSPGLPAAQHNAGMALMKMGNTAQAAKRFLRAVADEPEYPKPYYNLAAVCLARGRKAQAAALLREFLRLWDRHDGVSRAAQEKLSALEAGNGARVMPLREALSELGLL